MVVTEDQSGLSELGRLKTKPTPRWIAYQLDELEKKRSRLNKKMIRKSEFRISSRPDAAV